MITDYYVERKTINPNDLKFKVGANCCVCGPSQVGKTSFLINLVKYRQEVFDEKFDRIIYCEPFTSQESSAFETIKSYFDKAEHYFGVPNLQELNLTRNVLPCLLIFDDLMQPLLQSDDFMHMVIRSSHHLRISIFFSIHNYYAPSSRTIGKTIIKNCQYRVFFYNKLDQRELSTISSQICNSPKFFATNFKFLQKRFPADISHYLVIDGMYRQTCNEFWCRSKIFPDENNKLLPIYFLLNV